SGNKFFHKSIISIHQCLPDTSHITSGSFQTSAQQKKHYQLRELHLVEGLKEKSHEMNAFSLSVRTPIPKKRSDMPRYTPLQFPYEMEYPTIEPVAQQPRPPIQCLAVPRKMRKIRSNLSAASNPIHS